MTIYNDQLDEVLRPAKMIVALLEELKHSSSDVEDMCEYTNYTTVNDTTLSSKCGVEIYSDTVIEYYVNDKLGKFTYCPNCGKPVKIK